MNLEKIWVNLDETNSMAKLRYAFIRKTIIKPVKREEREILFFSIVSLKRAGV